MTGDHLSPRPAATLSSAIVLDHIQYVASLAKGIRVLAWWLLTDFRANTRAAETSRLRQGIEEPRTEQELFLRVDIRFLPWTEASDRFVSQQQHGSRCCSRGREAVAEAASGGSVPQSMQLLCKVSFTGSPRYFIFAVCSVRVWEVGSCI